MAAAEQKIVINLGYQKSAAQSPTLITRISISLPSKFKLIASLLFRFII